MGKSTVSTARRASAVVFAGSVMLGLSACGTSVSGSDASKGVQSASSQAGDAASSASSAAGGSSDSGSSSSDSAMPSTSSSSETSSDAGGTDSSGGLATGKVGDEIKTDKMSVKVTKVTEDVKSSSDYQKPDSGKHWVAINVSITNLSDKSLSVSDSCVKPRLGDNTSPQSDWVDYGSRLSFQDLPAKGDTAAGDIVYQVTNGQKIKTIDVDCSYGEDKMVRVKVD